MKCNSFPNCTLNCSSCPEYVPEDNLKDELQEYIEENEADSYLSSMEFHELERL